MMTMGAKHLTAAEFREWLAAAQPGDRIVYFRGAGLSEIPSKAALQKDVNAAALGALQTAAWNARDKVHLVQHRIGPRAIEYLAMKATDEVSG
jgi:hypothetical protein